MYGELDHAFQLDKHGFTRNLAKQLVVAVCTQTPETLETTRRLYFDIDLDGYAGFSSIAAFFFLLLLLLPASHH